MPGDFDYERGGAGYARRRRTDPRIAARVHAALGTARTVLNVGAGAGSYEPADRTVIAVEPSAAMRAQRPADRPAIAAVADRLPFADGSFDAAMAMMTVHQWTDPERGLRELRRVSRGPVLILTFDPDELDRLWLADYLPELIAGERGRFPAIQRIAGVLEPCTVTEVPVPLDCVDGFLEAYYGRPEAFGDPAVRRSQSSWSFLDPGVAERGLARLAADLADGAWDRRYGRLRGQPEFAGALRLVVGN
ncbi:MAG TPA: class I SAM-dependent methyltransferase [Jatrophihabitans sp.]|nr:class I SAM-dependent methyltransferase [Jatrophihabitans sp.]